MKHHPRTRSVDSLESRTDIDDSLTDGPRLERERHTASIKVERTQDLGIGIIGVHDHHAPRHNLVTQPGLRPAPLEKHFGREPKWRSHVGNNSGVEGNSFETPMRQRLAGNLEDSASTTSLDHLGQQGR
jgi:hypothetical protein